MKQNGLSRIGWLRLLMVSAQALLTVLVVLWLRGQWAEQGRFLQNQTDQLVTEVEREVFDTLILTTVVRPMLDSGSRVNFRFTFNTDSIRRITEKMADKKVITNLPIERGTVAIAISDTLKTTSKHRNITFKTRSDKSRLVIQGVKMFINELTDTASQFSFFSDSLIRFSDSVLFRQKLEAKLLTRLPGIGFVFLPTSDSSASSGTVFTAGDIGHTFPQVAFTGTTLWLTRQLVAEFLFALAVLALSASAFIVAFRSLKRQIVLNLMRDEFVSNLSHELKTPVATVKVALEALQQFNQKNDPERLTEYLTMAGLEMNRLELLINRVLSVSGLSGRRDLMVTEPVELKSLIKNTLRMMSARAEVAGASITLDVPDEEVVVSGDSLQLQGMLLNLLDNALKYGGPIPEISITLKETAGEVTMSVSDKGPGIAEPYREKVFERFFRIPTGNLHTVKGHGLGLSYARMVAGLHGGTLELDQSDLPGARFIIKLKK